MIIINIWLNFFFFFNQTWDEFLIHPVAEVSIHIVIYHSRITQMIKFMYLVSVHLSLKLQSKVNTTSYSNPVVDDVS